MQLNIFTDIALKSLIYLKQSERLTTINELAEAFSLPRNHLVKVLNFMVRQQWILSVRGRYGGLRYNPVSDTIRLGDIVLTLETKRELLNCQECMIGSCCFLRGILGEAQAAFYASLNRYTAADLLTPALTTALQPKIIHFQKLVASNLN